MDPEYTKVLALTTYLSKLEKVNNPPQSTTDQNQPTGRGCYNFKGKDPSTIYVEVTDNLKYWHIKKTN